MTEHTAEQVREKVDAVYRSESRRIFATLIRLLGDFELAEDALHDAFSAALERWPKEGVPANPRAWLVSAGRFKAIDAMRRRARFDASQAAIAEQFGAETRDAATFDDESIEDDRLRLIFTCCHPALAPEARVALTLRGGLRPDDRGDCARVPHPSVRAGSAHRARESEGPRCGNSVSGAVACGATGPLERGAPGDLPGV